MLTMASNPTRVARVQRANNCATTLSPISKLYTIYNSCTCVKVLCKPLFTIILTLYICKSCIRSGGEKNPTKDALHSRSCRVGKLNVWSKCQIWPVTFSYKPVATWGLPLQNGPRNTIHALLVVRLLMWTQSNNDNFTCRWSSQTNASGAAECIIAAMSPFIVVAWSVLGDHSFRLCICHSLLGCGFGWSL